MDTWQTFCALNERRRAIRHFDGSAIADDDMQAILEQTQLAPSSGNLQPYELHWVDEPELKAAIANACEAQQAARSASALVVVVAGANIGKRTLASQLTYIEASALNDASKTYYRAQLRKFAMFLRFAPWFVWAPLRMLLGLVNPARALVPIGPAGVSHWTARSGIYAAQTLMLAATARGLDSCPMEGFAPARVAKALKLERGSVIPIVIALGRRTENARVEPRWRRPFAETVKRH